MSQSQELVVASLPQHVFGALLNVEQLGAWWGCTAVVDARVGGMWVGGWGKGAGDLGHQTVLWAEIVRLEMEQLLSLRMGESEIGFQVAPHPEGCQLVVSLAMTGGNPTDELANLQSWVDAANNLKAYVEQHFKYVPPAKPAPPPVSPRQAMTPPPVAAKPKPQFVAQSQAEKPAEVAALQASAPGATDPFGATEALARGDIRVLDDGGFGVTDPHAVIKSWSKEQGFGYVTHAQLGDVVFDYDGCDFEPAPGDQVLVLVLKKQWNGKPKVKRIACQAKGSNIKR
jgi:uncharacterized protein YndB with AHSA1/START domain